MPTTAVTDSWLKDLIDHEFSPEELAARLVSYGIEIESIRDSRTKLADFRVAEVLSVESHPDADRLQICQVSWGADEDATVLCGAPNVAAGQKVAFAPVGTTMPDGSFTIERKKIRGIYSEGMICSEKELGLGEGHEGILVLDETTRTGVSIGDLLGDVVFEVDITPNRGDCLGHLGIAREIRAMNGESLSLPESDPVEVDPDVSTLLEVEIEDPDGCSRYIARVVRGVTVGESPEWLRRRLEAIGVRPINNVVDVASYVMFESGQPLHAFDYDKVSGGGIVVRASRPGEKIVTLDDKEREIPEGTVLICDRERPVALAGIMGGANSEIDYSSTSVLIESAWFDPARIRESARKIGLATDASYRFERGADPGVLEWAADRAASMIREIAGGEVLRGRVDAVARDHPDRDILLRFERTDEILGTVVRPERQVEILESLGFRLLDTNDASVNVRVPTWRSDIYGEIDLIEEIGRVFGLDNIPERRSIGELRFARPEPVYDLSRRLRTLLIAQGFSEVVPQYQTDPERAERYASGGAVELVNALGRESSAMRSSLVPGLASIVGRNERYGRGDLRLFEIGKAFSKSKREGFPIDGIRETEELAILLAGAAGPESWASEPRESDLFDMKGIVTRLIRTLGFPEPGYRATDKEEWGFGLPAISVSVDNVEFGRIGPIDDWLRSREEIAGNPVLFVADLTRMVGLPTVTPGYSPPGRYPVVTRDLSLLVPPEATHESIVAAIRGAGSDLLQKVDLFDIYEGDPGLATEGKKSMSYRLRFGSDERTLKDPEIEGEVSQIIASLASGVGATLRS